MSTLPPPPAHDPAPADEAAGAAELPEDVTSLGTVRDRALTADQHRRIIRTGFKALDRVLVGGLRTQNLTVIGGRPGAGKTVAIVQWARAMALAGETVLVACFEHDDRTLMDRLLLCELGELADELAYESRTSARDALRGVAAGEESLEEAVARHPALARAAERMDGYRDRVLFLRTSPSATTVQAVDRIVEQVGATVLMVDYLQKMPTDPWVDDDRVRAMLVAQGLKDLAMRRDVAVVAVAIADRSGLGASRLRPKHLESSSTISYEADLIMLLNTKFDVVHRNHIVYDPEAAKRFHRWTVWSVEKHRDGQDGVDVQLEKDFRHFRFQTEGEPVREQLIEEHHEMA